MSRLRMALCADCDGVGEVQYAATSKWGDPTPDGSICPICGGHGFDIEEDKGDSAPSLDEMDEYWVEAQGLLSPSIEKDGAK